MKGDADEETVAIGGVSVGRSPHIKKRALKNKALAISFNDKDLKDFVGGFHKRKKKRRKEAQQQIKEKDRLRRIEKRKQRKQEREYVGGTAGGSAPDETSDLEQDEEDEADAPVSVEETKTYDAGELTIMVKTSEICREGDQVLKENADSFTKPSGVAEKKHKIPVSKKQATFKRASKRRSGAKPQKKRDKRAAGKKREKR